ncbi:hypothetical protein EHH44_19430 [Mycolicibacter terrae]|jgi:hypothetical protein|uniref:PE-PGRS family protein n=2 Tax=Mycolicibacter TaxID=1073531 RepID=A0A1A2XNN2_MYCSD|nr:MULTISPECIES: hypothetical protein [Mycolicibacter]OBH17284.1 hypothetical protein A5694_04440 [Mycolicibacter sinensis]OBI26672.1 hypothetical protein A5710_06610 [Mycolicibacter sinensis]RRR41083.1 hypothetical protein EHH44_19430 [Mycolicibacter terrae]
MQQALRPYVTTGLAIVGVGLVAVPPVASQLPRLHSLAVVEQRAVELTAGGDFFSPYTDLFNHTAANLQALNQNSVDMWGLLEHIFTNPQQALAGIPDVINIFTNPLPTIDAQLLPFPADISVQLPTWLSSMLAGMGPWITLFNAMQDLMGQIFNFEDPMAALSALFGAPAILLDAFLNGHDTFDIGGFSIPLFNGLLTAGQPLGINIDIGTIVDASGMGNETLTGLLSEIGIGDTPLDTLIIDLLDQVGFGHMTPVDLLNSFGIGTESLSNLLIGLFNEAGIGNPTIAQLLTDIGGISPDDSIASLLIALLNSTDIGNPTLSELILQLVGGDDQSVGGLIKDLLGASGTESLASLVDPSWTVGGLLTDMVGNPPLTDFFEQLGLGSMTLGSALGGLFGEMGDDTLLDLLNNGFLGPDITGNTGLLALLSSMFPPGTTFNDFIGDYGNQTLGQVLSAMPVGVNTLGIDPLTPLTDIKFTQLMTIAGIGDTPLATLSPENASLIEKIGNPTLNALLGTNTVGQTLSNLHLYDATVSQMVQAVGLSNYQLETLFNGLANLTGNVTLEQFFTDIGFNPTLTDLMDRILEGLGLSDTTLLSLFESWGMGSIGLENLIDSLGLDNLNIASMLSALGLNNIDLDMFIDRIGLSGISIAGLLSDLGMNTRHLDEVINDLLGGVSIGSMLGGLGLDEVHLDTFITDLMTSVLGDPTLGTLLGWLGLDSNDLDTIVANLGLGGVTINSLLTDLGLGTTTIENLLSGLGLSDLGLVDINADFYGLIPQWLNDIPQQIAEALGFFG